MILFKVSISLHSLHKDKSGAGSSDANGELKGRGKEIKQQSQALHTHGLV